MALTCTQLAILSPSGAEAAAVHHALTTLDLDSTGGRGRYRTAAAL